MLDHFNLVNNLFQTYCSISLLWSTLSACIIFSIFLDARTSWYLVRYYLVMYHNIDIPFHSYFSISLTFKKGKETILLVMNPGITKVRKSESPSSIFISWNSLSCLCGIQLKCYNGQIISEYRRTHLQKVKAS